MWLTVSESCIQIDRSNLASNPAGFYTKLFVTGSRSFKTAAVPASDPPSECGIASVYGLLKRKNRLPVGGVIVMLFVPLAVVMEYPLVVQLAVAAGLLFCSKV